MKSDEVFEHKDIIFKEGIPGFEHLTKFRILEGEDDIFYYLQSVEEKAIILPIIDPYLIKPDYTPNIHESYFEKLGGGHTEDYAVYVVATIRDNMEETTINLQAPLLIHVEKRIGVQAIVEDKVYQSRHKILTLIQERGA